MMKRQRPGLPNILGDVITLPLRWLGWKACSAFTHGWRRLVMVISAFESKPELTVQIHSFQVRGETIMGFPFSVWVTQIPAEYCVFQMLTRVSKMQQKISWKIESDSDLDRFGVWRRGGGLKKGLKRFEKKKRLEKGWKEFSLKTSLHEKCELSVYCTVLKIGFMKSEILMPGLLVLLLQYFVVVLCVPGAHGLHVCPQHNILGLSWLLGYTGASVCCHPLIFERFRINN